MYLLFDIGGTKTRLAYSADGTTFGEYVKFDTPKDFDEGIEKIKAEKEKLCLGKEVIAAGGGVAGPMNREKTMLVNSPNLSGWNTKPVKDALSDAFGVPAYIENDSAIVGLGEACAGAGRGYEIVAYMTVSTGVGGARIVDGRIDRNVHGFEPGHQIIDIDGTLCPACKVETDDPNEAEELISGTATAIRFGKKAYEVTDPQVWEELSKWLAVVVNNTVVHWSPDVVVLGGSMIVGDPAIPVDRTETHLQELLIFADMPHVKSAELADIGGLHGALAFVKQCQGEV